MNILLGIAKIGKFVLLRSGCHTDKFPFTELYALNPWVKHSWERTTVLEFLPSLNRPCMSLAGLCCDLMLWFHLMIRRGGRGKFLSGILKGSNLCIVFKQRGSATLEQGGEGHLHRPRG